LTLKRLKMFFVGRSMRWGLRPPIWSIPSGSR
jgi:hypothetical protein